MMESTATGFPLANAGQVEAERAALKHFDEPGSQWGGADCTKVLSDWFPRLQERVRKRKNADADLWDYQEEIGDAFWILNGLREAFSGNVNRTLYDAVQDEIWAWPNDKDLLWPPIDKWRHEHSPADVKQLTSALAEYVERPWLQHNIIDGAAINAFLFDALSSATHLYRMGAFGRADWAHMLRFMGWHPVLSQISGLFLSLIFFPFLKWIMFPGISAILLLQGYNTAAEVVCGVWIAFVLYGLVTLRGRRARRKDADRTTAAIGMAWEHSRGIVINPTRLRELVLDAEQKVWTYPSVLHTLIDRAIQRDPTAMLTRKMPASI